MLNRRPENPILHPGSIEPLAPECQITGMYNPGSVTFQGETLLLVQEALTCKKERGIISIPYFEDGDLQILKVNKNDSDLKFQSPSNYFFKGRQYPINLKYIRLARSSDGINFTLESTPFIYPQIRSNCTGIKDSRVVKIGDIYYITYTVESPDGNYTALATTNDFKSIDNQGVIFPPLINNVAIFSEKIDGRYTALFSPGNKESILPSIWISTSPDLIHWGNHKCLLRPNGSSRESRGIYSGCSPIKTREGWLVIFHAIGDDNLYSLNLLLLDLKEPSRIVRRGTYPILLPRKEYEKNGANPGVIFSNGVVTKSNGEVWIYYGACHQSVCLAVTSTYELLEQLNI